MVPVPSVPGQRHWKTAESHGTGAPCPLLSNIPEAKFEPICMRRMLAADLRQLRCTVFLVVAKSRTLQLLAFDEYCRFDTSA